MNATNPYHVLRNNLAQQAIRKAEQCDHAMIAEYWTSCIIPAAGKTADAGKRTVWAPPSGRLLNALLQFLSPTRDPPAGIRGDTDLCTKYVDNYVEIRMDRRH